MPRRDPAEYLFRPFNARVVNIILGLNWPLHRLALLHSGKSSSDEGISNRVRLLLLEIPVSVNQNR